MAYTFERPYYFFSTLRFNFQEYYWHQDTPSKGLQISFPDSPVGTIYLFENGKLELTVNYTTDDQEYYLLEDIKLLIKESASDLEYQNLIKSDYNRLKSNSDWIINLHFKKNH